MVTAWWQSLWIESSGLLAFSAFRSHRNLFGATASCFETLTLHLWRNSRHIHYRGGEVSVISNLSELRRATPQQTPPRHLYCLRSWMAAIVADCVWHLTARLQSDVRSEPPGERDLMPRWPQTADTRRIRVLLAYRETESRGPLTRNITNRGALSSALSGVANQSPPLQLMEGPLERLPLQVQVRLALLGVEVMIQPFGAGMSWSTLFHQGDSSLRFRMMVSKLLTL